MNDSNLATMSVGRFHDRIASLQCRGAYQEANALVELAQWFEPPIKVDERRIERLVRQRRADMQRAMGMAEVHA